MADQSAATAAVNKMVFSAVANLEGKINFDQVAKDIEVANAEAARKRFKRFLEREKIDLLVKGNDVGSIRGTGETAAPAAATNLTTSRQGSAKKGLKTLDSNVKAKDVSDAEEEGPASNKKTKLSKSTAKSAEKKRKAAKVDMDDDSSLNCVGDIKKTAEEDVAQEG